MLPKITRITPKTVKDVPASSHFVTFSSLFRNRCAKKRVIRGLVDAIGVTVTTLDMDKAVNKLINMEPIQKVETRDLVAETKKPEFPIPALSDISQK